MFAACEWNGQIFQAWSTLKVPLTFVLAKYLLLKVVRSMLWFITIWFIPQWSQRMDVRGEQLFKTIFLKITAVCGSKTAARRIVGTEMGIPAYLIRQPAAASKTKPNKWSGGKLHLRAAYAPVVGLGRKTKRSLKTGSNKWNLKCGSCREVKK